MTDRPYTDDDLRDAAAHSHHAEAIAQSLNDTRWWLNQHEIASRPGMSWNALHDQDRDAAVESVCRLLEDSADTSRWAIDLGADGLEPDGHHADFGSHTTKPGPLMRLHFAFHLEVTPDMRHALAELVSETVEDALASVAEPDDESTDADSEVFALIAEIAGRLQDATDEGEYHAVGLIYDLAQGRTTVADARAELADITFRHV